MATGRIRRTARRGVAAAIIGWLGVAGLAVLMAPSASADPTATVTIRDLTPPAVSLDAGGTVTFVNGIAAKTLPLVGVVHTEVTLGLPSGAKPLPAGTSVAERFSTTCATCTISYAYRLQSGGAVTGAILSQLPALPAVPTPFVVTTVPLPNLPSTNLPALPALPALPELPQVITPPPPGGGGSGGPLAPDGTTPPGEAPPPGTAAGDTGNPYDYGLPAGSPRMSAGDAVAAAAFDPQRFFVPGQSLGTADRAGSGGLAGGYDGASVPVFGQLAGLDGSSLDEESAERAAASVSSAQTLPIAALAAVIALAAVTAALVRTHQAQRSSR
jgi:hypothetical protein